MVWCAWFSFPTSPKSPKASSSSSTTTTSSCPSSRAIGMLSSDRASSSSGNHLNYCKNLFYLHPSTISWTCSKKQIKKLSGFVAAADRPSNLRKLAQSTSHRTPIDQVISEYLPNHHPAERGAQASVVLFGWRAREGKEDAHLRAQRCSAQQ